MIGLIFVRAIPERIMDVHNKINIFENILKVKLLTHEIFNILVFTQSSDFMSLSKTISEINNIDGVESITHAILFGPEGRPDAATVLKDEKARVTLARYFDVIRDNKPAKFLIAKKNKANFNRESSLVELWRIHDQLTEEFYILEREIDTHEKSLELLKKMKKPEISYLDLKIEIAKRILTSCILCVRRCGVNRLEGELGDCKCGAEVVLSSASKHWGEEAELTPSGAIFTMGCNLHCRHCANWKTSQWIKKGEVYSEEKMARVVENLRRSGCRNAFLTGEPTPWLKHWLETFKHVSVNTPVVWNSNSYYSEETSKLLSGFVDLYVLDFKYGSNKCAERISDAPKYWETCTRNIMYGKRFGELIVRVLILPGHHECCTEKRLNWIANNLGKDARTNLVLLYQPTWRSSEIPELQRRLTIGEMERTVELAEVIGLTNLIK
ncbi:radical SAM protein [Candidatus Bathyarchaeota archaeon]|nr:radical SAM protein [Candidatus Bathyarchaeota archaeon]